MSRTPSPRARSALRVKSRVLSRGGSLSPSRMADEDFDGDDRDQGASPHAEHADRAMGGWGATSRRQRGQGVEVARRNLRTHERNHSWGGLESKPLDDMAQGGDGGGKKSGPFAAHGAGLPAAEVPWYEVENEMAGLNITSPKGPADKMFHSIMMLSDFFYPDAGGVENHMFMLSQCLIHLGHKVIVVTRARGNRQGVRWLGGGLKVYYLPLMPMPDVFSSGRVSLPTLFSSFPILRNICIRERITIVHGHQAFSIICHEGLMHAGTMGLKVIFTDHSLFGFSDPSAIHMNKVLNFTCSITNHVICVSHTSKENTVLRANIPPHHVSVIPNAVDTTVFTPNPAARKSNCITIVCLTRLVYRKGVDLMVEIIPAICKRFDHVNFVIGGDGPMRVALDQMRENHQLQDRVEMLGQVQHTNVRNVLVRGHIYLNCSLTEAFCIAILEAACCGLLVVSTKVGGVPEVMPSHMIKYAAPDAKELTTVLSAAIVEHLKDVVPQEFHDSVEAMYSWRDVAMRTAKVYDKVARDEPKPLIARLEATFSRGAVFGILISMLVALDFLLWRFISYLLPEQDIEFAVDYPNAHKQQQSTQSSAASKTAAAAASTQQASMDQGTMGQGATSLTASAVSALGSPLSKLSGGEASSEDGQGSYDDDDDSGDSLAAAASQEEQWLRKRNSLVSDPNSHQAPHPNAHTLQPRSAAGVGMVPDLYLPAHAVAGANRSNASHLPSSNQSAVGSKAAESSAEPGAALSQELKTQDGKVSGEKKQKPQEDWRQFLGPMANGKGF